MEFLQAWHTVLYEHNLRHRTLLYIKMYTSLVLLPYEEMPATNLRPPQAAFVQDQDAERLIVGGASEFLWSWYCHEIVCQVDTS